MKVLDISIVDYDAFVDAYIVKYCIEVSDGIFRKSKAIYMDNKLSRDNDRKELVKSIRDKIRLYKHSNALR